jgi:hypothetical protein
VFHLILEQSRSRRSCRCTSASASWTAAPRASSPRTSSSPSPSSPSTRSPRCLPQSHYPLPLVHAKFHVVLFFQAELIVFCMSHSLSISLSIYAGSYVQYNCSGIGAVATDYCTSLLFLFVCISGLGELPIYNIPSESY